MIDEVDKYIEDMKTIATQIAKDLLETSGEMKNQMLLDIMESLERGEDVYDELLSMILTRPFMEKFIDKLIEYEEE